MSKTKSKSLYNCQVEEEHTPEIRAYITAKKKETGRSKKRIVTELLLKGIEAD